MRTRKGSGLFSQLGRKLGVYHEPSTSKLMRNFLEIYGQPYVNVRPILKEWTVEKNNHLLLDPRYESVFLEIYCKVFSTFTRPFSVIFDFEKKVNKYITEKKQDTTVLLETLILYVQKYLKQEKKIPANAYDWIMDWIDYMETFKPSSEISKLKRVMEGSRGEMDDPKWSVIRVMPKAPVQSGGEPEKDPMYVSPDPIVGEIFLTIIVFLIKFLIVLLSGGTFNPFG